MVFTKLTDIQKQNLFELKETHSPTTISSMRALIMRGASVDEAKKNVEERKKAKQEYLEQLDKEIEAAKKKTKVKVKEPTPEQAQAPEPKPKKAKAKAKVKEDKAPISSAEPATEAPQPEEPVKPKRGKAKAKADDNTLEITL